MFGRANATRCSLVFAALMFIQPFASVILEGYYASAKGGLVCAETSTHVRPRSVRRSITDQHQPADDRLAVEQHHRSADAPMGSRRASELVSRVSGIGSVDVFVEIISKTMIHNALSKRRIDNHDQRIAVFEHAKAPMHETRGKPQVRSFQACESRDDRMTGLIHEVRSNVESIEISSAMV